MIRPVVTGAVIAALCTVQVRAATLTVTPSKDNTIFTETDTSNGLGAHLFAGRTTIDTLRRALLRFDVSSIPVGSTVTAVSIRLRCTQSSFVAPSTSTFVFRRLTADWGEGSSDAGVPGGMGAPAAPGDATWTERFFGQAQPWTTAGGDFAAATSASFTMLAAQQCTDPAPIVVSIASTAQLVGNVQNWVNNPANNFGWILFGDETVQLDGRARRFASREHATAINRPTLSVTYTPPPPVAGAVPNDDDIPGAPLVLDRPGGGLILLDWSPSCSVTATNYAVYEGAIGSWYSHDTSYCSTGGLTSFTLTPAANDSYYLVVPIASGQEGSYGTDDDDVERPPSGAACFPQDLVPLCP